MIHIRLIDKGIIEYSEAFAFQSDLFEEHKRNREAEDCLIYCEHPHVYTLGKHGSQNNLLVSQTFLNTIGATYHITDRGGDITYHGYGQLVGYPIINLEHFSIGLKEYIYRIEEAVIETIGKYGIRGKRVEHATGVWVDADNQEKKICAIGVKASRFITMHGFALNVNTDLKYFSYINPCGFTDKGVTSIKELTGGKDVNFDEVKKIFATAFARQFGGEIE